MKLKYKLEIHKRKGEKNKNVIRWHWKNKKSDKYALPQIEYCCVEIEKAIGHGFISIETTQTTLVDIKYDERSYMLKEPSVCLSTYSEDGFNDDGCPHEEKTIAITRCPFCAAPITTELVEKKRVTHECKKVKKTYEECEDKVTEEIL